MMTEKTKRGKPVITSIGEVPEFTSEQEEAEFWDSVDWGAELLATMQPLDPNLLPVRARTKPIAIRFDEDVLARLRALAAKKRKGYQSLIKEFVVERLYEEEKREGILPAPSSEKD